MPEDEQAQRERAEQLRKQIEQMKSHDNSEKDHLEIKPGEPPKEYIERRMREISRKNDTDK